MKLLKLDKKAYEYYRFHVKGNEDTSFEQARRKLTRNVLLGKQISKSFLKTIYQYGNMYIAVRLGKVIKIKNYKGIKHTGWKLDKKKYIELSEMFGVIDRKFK